MKKQRQFSLRNHKQESEINLSPLIDLIFILLIFFIVTAAIVNESGISASTPDLNTSTNHQEDQTLIITLERSGKIISQNKNIPLTAIESFVKKELSKKSKSVILETQTSSSSEIAIKIMDSAYQGGAENVALRSIH